MRRKVIAIDVLHGQYKPSTRDHTGDRKANCIQCFPAATLNKFPAGSFRPIGTTLHQSLASAVNRLMDDVRDYLTVPLPSLLHVCWMSWMDDKTVDIVARVAAITTT